MPTEQEKDRFLIKLALGGISLALFGVSGCMFGMPRYNVWHQRMEGQAMLAKSEAAKQVMVQDAKAREESSHFQAQAEIIRAEGVAKANKIIGASLKGNEAYLHYLWIHNLEEGNHDVIYVPTEANMPVMEAGARFQHSFDKSPESGTRGTAEHPESD